MIKIIYCVRRRAELSREEFSSYWRETHGPLVKRHAAALGVRRYTQSHTLDDPRLRAAIDARGGAVEAYDGVAEIWWENLEDVVRLGETKEQRDGARELLTDEARFIDLARSTVFFAEELVVVG